MSDPIDGAVAGEGAAGEKLGPAPLRVLHCPSAVGGHPPGLARAERAEGLDSRAVCFVPNPYGYRGVDILVPPGVGPLRAEWRRWRLFAHALLWADVIHFNFGRTILPSLDSAATADALLPAPVARLYRVYARALEYRDLGLFRSVGKVIAVTFQGDDARQGDRMIAFPVNPVEEADPGCYTAERDARRRRIIRSFDRYADLIYALNPDLLRVLPERSRFVPYAHVDPREWQPVGVDAASRSPLRIAHAPTSRGTKGTRFLVGAVERLRADGVAVELEVIEGRTQPEVRERLARADLVVDQLLVGFYGGLSVEAMALAKPVVCYLRSQDLAFLPPQMAREIPIIRADPASIEDVLRKWAAAPRARLADRGAAGRAFVCRWHDPRRIAAQHRADYEAVRRCRRGAFEVPARV